MGIANEEAVKEFRSLMEESKLFVKNPVGNFFKFFFFDPKLLLFITFFFFGFVCLWNVAVDEPLKNSYKVGLFSFLLVSLICFLFECWEKKVGKKSINFGTNFCYELVFCCLAFKCLIPENSKPFTQHSLIESTM